MMKRHSVEEQQSLYKEWQISGEKKKSFSLRKGISPSTFHYWTKKFAKPVSEKSSSSSFHQIQLADTVQCESPCLIIRYPNGILIEWRGSLESIHLLSPLLQ